jgi:hypothetical protein
MEADLIVKRQYCDEHRASGHYCDENYHCHGATLIDVEKRGYTYARHVGGGWFKLQPKPSNFTPEFWAEPEYPEHDIHVLEPDF